MFLIYNGPVYERSKSVANRTYPICHGHLKRGTKTSYTETELFEGETVKEPLVDILRCISVKRKVSNEIIPSVKCSKLWTDRAIISKRPSMTLAKERQPSVTYILIPPDICEHV